MILEFLESLFTPVSREARKLGYVYESIAIRQRYRRHKKDWANHIAKCHQATLKAVDKIGDGKSILILGSGPLLEIPMTELTKRFERISLVDFVHPLPVRSKWGKDPRVKLIEMDLTGVAGSLLTWRAGEDLPPVKPPELTHFRADFILSANCLSQLPLKPRRYLENKVDEARLNKFSEDLSSAHLQAIKAAGLPHLVITDFETKVIGRGGEITEVSTPFFDRARLMMLDSWKWNLAPRGEIYRDRAVEMTAGAFTIKSGVA